jgi:type IV secretion system protein VirB11
MSIAALETFLGPLKELLERGGVNEISINRPGEVWLESKGEMVCEKVPELTFDHLKSLARLVAQSTSQMISEEYPLLSATLPAGYRIQIVFPPAVEPGHVAMSIRKQNAMKLSLREYEALGAFQSTSNRALADKNNVRLKGLIDGGEIRKFLAEAVKAKKNIVISGGTSSGKTTFLNAALTEIPDDERLITIEDAREISLDQPNKVHLMVSKGDQGRAKVTTTDLIEACLRLAPSRILVGELRGAEAFSFLRAVNTGHPGSVATLHADTPALAFEQLVMMVMQAGIGMTREEIVRYIHNVIEVVVQLKKGAKGRRYVSEIYFNPIA